MVVRSQALRSSLRVLSALTLFGVAIPCCTSALPLEAQVSQAQAIAAPSGLPLEERSSNPEAGEVSRYSLIFPPAAGSDEFGNATFVLLFHADFDVQIYEKRLKLCYFVDPAQRMPARHRCVEEIPARVSVKTGDGEDEITVESLQPLNKTRLFGLRLDLHNPAEPGRYWIKLRRLVQASAGVVERRELGHWSVRIEQRNPESPGR